MLGGSASEMEICGGKGGNSLGKGWKLFGGKALKDISNWKLFNGFLGFEFLDFTGDFQPQALFESLAKSSNNPTSNPFAKNILFKTKNKINNAIQMISIKIEQIFIFSLKMSN